MSRLGKQDDGVKTQRVGLSDYTSQRLAELSARHEDNHGNPGNPSVYKPASKPALDNAKITPSVTSQSALDNAKITPSVTSQSATVSTSDLLESYRARRGLPTNGTRSVRQPSDCPHNNGTSNELSPTKTTNTKSGPAVADSPGPESKISNMSAPGPEISNMSAMTKRSLSVSQASNGSRSDGHKTTVTLNRSQSARVPQSIQGVEDFVGFATLPEQVHRKAIKRGFDFTLMVVGETGLGKSTLISSLFLNPKLYKDRTHVPAQDCLSRTVEIEKKYMEIEEKGVKLRLTVVDTPGFNDSMNSEQSCHPIERYISEQFNQYLRDESGINRKNIKDERVHCCLYFISPYGHSLRQIDIQFMKRLHDKVNIVPVIAKSDTLTPREVKRLKERVLDEITEHGIRIYEFPDCDSDEDDDFKKQDSELKASVPFAVIGSNTVVEVNGQKMLGRLYPWGVVEVDNSLHSDFSKLRMMIISTHMQDLKDVTQDVHYENFRAQHIEEQMTKNQRERNKLKRDSSPNFESVMDQAQLLQQKDDEIRRMHEMLARMQQQLKSGQTAVHH